jgi:hypothetical protein
VTIQLKRNDTKYNILYTLQHPTKDPVDLTGASVRFVMGKGNKLITNAPADILNASTGEVVYEVTEQDTLLPGAWQAEFEVTFADGKVKTYPNSGYIQVTIHPNIDHDKSTEIEESIALRVSLVEEFKEEVNAKVTAAEEAAAQVDYFQTQLDTMTIEGDSSVEAAQARVEADGTTNATLKARLDKKDSQTEQKFDEVASQMAQTETQQSIYKQKASNFTDFVKRDFRYYQAVVKNPLNDIAYTNEPVGIYVSFEPNECKSINCIEVFDSNGNLIPFQWENDKHVNPLIGTNIGEHSNGYLANGTIWILSNFAPNEEKTFTIKVYENERSNTYTSNVTHTVVDASNEHLLANGVKVDFTEWNNFMPMKVTVDGADVTNTNIAFGSISVFHNDTNRTEYNSQRLTQEVANVIPFSHEALGSGVVFMEMVSIFKFKLNSNIRAVTKTRLWANGKIDTDDFVFFDVTMNPLTGVVFKYKWDRLGTGRVYEVEKSSSYRLVETNSSKVRLGVLHDIQRQTNESNHGYVEHLDWSAIGDPNQTKLHSGWKNSSIFSTSIPVNSFWSSRMRFSFKGFTQNDYLTEANRLMNRIHTRATKMNATDLKQRFVTLSKMFLENMFEHNKNNTVFPGCKVVANLALMKMSGRDLLPKIKYDFDNMISNLYHGGSTDGIWTAFMTDNRSIAFIGRDMYSLKYLRKEYESRSVSSTVTYITNVTHNLADFFVRLETESGGEGKVSLTNDLANDNSNAQSSAMKFIKWSLDIEENATRRSCYDRIKARYLTQFVYRNREPYSIGQNISLYVTNHYHAFSVSDYLDSEPNPNEFAPRQFVMEYTSPAGQTKEIGYQFTRERRGLMITGFYAAAILFKMGNVSDLQQACSIIEYNLSKSYPTGWHEYPVDGWKRDNADSSSGDLIETQILGECILQMELA